MEQNMKSITLPSIFCDRMILQRQKPVRIWGSSRQNEKIQVRLQGQCIEAIPQEGKWEAILEPMEACLCTELDIVSGQEQIRIQEIAIGEVWLAGGQSNMEFQMRYDAGRKAAAVKSNPYIRTFDYPKVSYEGELERYSYPEHGFWRSFEGAHQEYFSAVGYYFAERLYEQYQVPAGIVGCNWGGTPACAWMDPEYLKGTSGEIWLTEYEEAVKNLDIKEYNRRFDENPANYMGKPFDNPFLDKMMFGWSKEEWDDIFRSFKKSGEEASDQMVMGPRNPNRPGGLYETMLKKLAPYTIKGALWYQGESDDTHASAYQEVFPSLIRCWRKLWEEELPFLFVQLAPFEHYRDSTLYPVIRRAQDWTAKHVPEVYMASIMDVGNQHDIHPKEKKPVGTRLAALALGHIYGEEIICDAPECTKLMIENGEIILSFRNAAEEMCIRGETLLALELNINGERLTEWEAETRGSQVYIRIPGKIVKETDVVKVEFAQKDYCEVNLFNQAGFPALPFTKQHPILDFAATEIIK